MIYDLNLNKNRMITFDDVTRVSQVNGIELIV